MKFTSKLMSNLYEFYIYITIQYIMIIYLTTNKVNNKKYIGMDSNNNPKYLGSGSLILKSIKKYGKENFTKEILEYCDSREEMEERETYWINKYNSLKDPNFYNLEDNLKRGIDPFWNKSEEERQKIFKKRGDSQRGIPKVGNMKPKPEYFSQLLKERFKNRGPRTLESRRKQSETKMGKPKNQKVKTWKQSLNSTTLLPVDQYSKDGKFIKRWNSQREVQDTLGINRRCISMCINNNIKTSGGFIWKKTINKVI